jgi:DNA repair protein RAD50
MASVNKLSIRGIRSFSPEDAEQVVEFYFPCTIIVGANGCGKTTIIESLKYAVTGSFPPGNKAGQAFVHDPRTIGQPQVKANVKLRFTSRSGQTMVVVRSMEVNQKKTAMTFKQLDGVLRMMDPNTGQRVSLSHKCTELDKQLPALLGVSKSILEHVVFCHQEDASWPLMEGAVLKKRFDDIFDSTRYTKALDAFRKTEKEMTATVKDLKIELAGLNSSKIAADGFRKDLVGYQEALETLEEEKQQVVEGIAEADRDIQVYQGIEAKINNVDAKIDSLKNQQAQLVQVRMTRQQMLEEDLTKKHSQQELEQMLDDFGGKVSEQLDQHQKMQQRYEGMEKEVDTLRHEEIRLNSLLGKLSAEKEAHEGRLLERYKMMETIAQMYSIDLHSVEFSQGSKSLAAATLSASLASQNAFGSQDDLDLAAGITSNDMHSFYIALEKNEEDLSGRLRDFRGESQARDDALQNELATLGGQLSVSETERAKLASRRNGLQKELSAISSQVAKPSWIRMTDIEDARKHAIKFAKSRDEANQNPRRKEIPTEILHLQSKIDSIKRTIDLDQELLDRLRSTAESQNAINVLQEQAQKDLDELNESIRDQSQLLQKYNFAFEGHFAKEDDDNGEKLGEVVCSLVSAIGGKYESFRADLDRASCDVSKNEKVASEKAALLANSQRAAAGVRSKLDGLHTTITTARKLTVDLQRHEQSLSCTARGDENDPREIIKYLEERLDSIEEDSPSEEQPKAIKKVLKRLYKMSKIRDASGEITAIRCPCCRQDLGGRSAEDMKAMLDELKVDPALTEIDEKAIEHYKNLKETYQGWKEQVEKMSDDLRDVKRLDNELSDHTKDVEKFENELGRYRRMIVDDIERRDEATVAFTEIRELFDVAKRWSTDVARIVGKKMQINQKTMDLPFSGNDGPRRDLETVEREMTRNIKEKDTLMLKINDLNREMMNLNNEVSDLATKAANTDKALRDKEAKYVESQQAAERKMELTRVLQEISAAEKEIQKSMGPLHEKIKVKEDTKRQQRYATNEQEHHLQDALSQFRNDFNQLREISRQIEEHTSSDKGQKDVDVSSQMTKVLALRNKMVAELQVLRPELDGLMTAVNDQERHKKQLKANIDVLAANKQIQELEEGINSLQEERESIDGADTASERLSNAKSTKEKQASMKSRIEGRWHEIVEQIRAVKRKLSSPDYKNVDEKFRIALIDVETTQIASEDLKKYGNALDKAILKFHHVKIDDINKIVRELWLLTYKGEDISSIELVSGQEAGSRAQKSYNYRVVMTKGTSKLDMRGRCSAGQRVLASIVIRLALAETFCINCGCIALDEPTVNLDHRTKKGLAVALAQIIASRSQQRNFQLILITHDEEFVAMMKTELSTLTGFSMPEKYFQVRRELASDGKYYSKISAVDWDELV